MESDRRKHLRVPASISIKFVSPKAFVQQYVENISKGGLFIASPHPPAIRSEVVLILHLPQTKVALQLRAQVVYIPTSEDGKPTGMGLEFVGLTDQQSETIERYVHAVRDQMAKESKAAS